MSKNKKNRGRSADNALVRYRKPLLFSGGALMALAIGYKLMNLDQLSNELEIDQSVQVWSVSLTGITLRIDLVLKNPTPAQVRVKTPYLTVNYNGQMIASSDVVSGANAVVQAYGATPLEPIYITLKLLTLATSAYPFYKQYNQTGQARISIRALTRINDIVPIEKITVFDLSKDDSGGSKAGATIRKVATAPTRIPPVRELVNTVKPPASYTTPLPVAKLPVARAVAQPLPAVRRAATTAKRGVVKSKTTAKSTVKKGAKPATKSVAGRRPTATPKRKA